MPPSSLLKTLTLGLTSALLLSLLVACGVSSSNPALTLNPTVAPTTKKLYACGDDNSGEDGPGIIGGHRLKRRSLLARSVVYLRQVETLENENGENTTCTATLIAPNMLITAAHCVEGKSAEKRAERTKVYFNTDPYCTGSRGISDEIGQVEAVTIHPEYAPTNEKIKFDVALLKLKNPAPEGYRPLPVARKFQNLNEDSAVFLAGFGITTDYDVDDSSAPLLRFAKVKPFANPDNFKSVQNQPDSPRLIFDQNGGGACRGDSGGPAILFANGKLRLIGVASQIYSRGEGGTTCKAYVLHTSVSFYNEWLKDTFKQMNPDFVNPFSEEGPRKVRE